MNVVVDANIVVKLYVDEEGPADVQALFAGRQVMVAPGHLLGEVGEVLVRAFRQNRIGLEQLNKARFAIPGSILLVTVNELFTRAIELAVDFEMSVYDAFYVSAAEYWDTILVTSDAGIARKLAGSTSAARVVSLRDWAARNPPT